MYLMPLNCTLEMANAVLCIFYHNNKCFEKRKTWFLQQMMRKKRKVIDPERPNR